MLTAPLTAACALAALAAPAACGTSAPLPVEPATVVSTRTEPVGQTGTTRVVATLRDAEGRTWDVRLPADTACVKDARYPDCTEN